MTSPAARLFQRQMADASEPDGTVCLTRLADLVTGAYAEADNDRRRTARTAQVMATELEEVNETLEATVAALRVQNLRFGIALENMANGLALFGADGRLVVSNRRQYEILAIDGRQAPPGCTFAEFLRASPMLSESQIEERLQLVASGGEGVLQQTLLDDRSIRVVVRTTADGGFLTGCEDVTERNAAVARIAFLAYHDTLTGLPNRELLRDRLERHLRDGACAVLCLDLDGFKTVNDTMGHSMGDSLLREVSNRLGNQIRAEDTLARLGGDEFAAVIVGGLAEATMVARRMLEAVGARYSIGGKIINISTSIGIAIAPAHGGTPEDLMRLADVALYRAKADGRRCIRFYETSMGAAIDARQRVEHDLRAAFSAGQLEVYYQPQVGVKTRGVTGFEALLRWRDPDRGFVSPEHFIPVAEESGLIVPIGAWVLREACQQASLWPGGQWIAVNVSPVQLRGSALFEAVTDALEETGLPPERLELEITETAMLRDSGTVLSVLKRLRAIGVRIVLDDFGTGYSSLNHLHSFPLDGIKIDRSFIQDLEHEARSLAIVRAVTGLGSSLNIPVIAEGVETEAQLAILARENCDYAQGYLFGRPMPVRDARAMLLAPASGSTAPAEAAR